MLNNDNESSYTPLALSVAPRDVHDDVHIGPPSQSLDAGGHSRGWKLPLWHVLGDYTAEDAIACALASSAPWCAFSWNMQRALQLPFWHEFAKILLFFIGLFIFKGVMLFIVLTLMLSMCGAVGAGVYVTSDLPPQCRGKVEFGNIFVTLVTDVLGIGCVAYYAAFRRGEIRKRFGIAGTMRDDFISWAFCSCCTLAQETRTLMGGQVADGVWCTSHDAHSAPMEQQMPSLNNVV